MREFNEVGYGAEKLRETGEIRSRAKYGKLRSCHKRTRATTNERSFGIAINGRQVKITAIIMEEE